MPRRPQLLSPLALIPVVLAVCVTGAPASAATTTGPHGWASSRQDTFDHRLQVIGWAYDGAHPMTSIAVRLYADGHYLGRVLADRPSATADRAQHIGGRHGFAVTLTRYSTVTAVTVRTSGASTSAPMRTVHVSRTGHYQPAPGARIVTVARRYVGKARYVEGGTSPRTGFDCSGFTAYVYATAKVATLPHNAEAQRHVRGMHVVSAARAVPGDLVFYFSGGAAYHVAVYAGHGMQYAAATPKDGIRYQAVWSRSVEYRHRS